MDQGSVGTVPASAPVTSGAPADGPPDATGAASPVPAPRRRPSLARDLVLLGIVGIVLAGALAAGGAVLYAQFYSPKAFVERYLSLLSQGHAADALTLPGVSVDSAELEAAGLPLTSSEALLRRAALGTLVVDSLTEQDDGDVTHVSVSYTASGHAGSTTFDIERAGWIGVVPEWRFARSPLAVLDLTVRGSMRFSVNGFEVDKRQVSADGVDAKPLDPIPMLVFSPGSYRVAVDTPISSTPGVDVLADEPLADVPVELQAEPTDEFVKVVQERVDGFLADCAKQEVLQPTGCPFGYIVDDRIDGLPSWSIAKKPTITVEPDGANWKIPAARATARIDVDIVSLFDGSVRHVRDDVPFVMNGEIIVMPDGTVSIRIGSP